MSDLPTSARHDGGRDGRRTREHGAHPTLSGAGPVRPQDGTPLAMLLRRQSALSTEHLLAFVPAQVR